MQISCKLDRHVTRGLLRKPPAGSGFAQCRVVADSGPNSGTGDALGHSGTGVGGEVGGEVEEVLMLVVVVVVVRTRYR